MGTYGHIIALGGDFDGCPSLKPISDGQDFGQTVTFLKQAWNSLQLGDVTELPKILALVDAEETPGPGGGPGTSRRDKGWLRCLRLRN